MNGLEQRQRFTAVQRVESQLEDVQLIVSTLAGDLVKHGKQVTEDLQVFHERLRLYHEAEAARLDDEGRVLALRVDALERQLVTFTGATRWQRIRWALSF